MGQGIRTINGYTNNYPVVTTLSGTAKWNTTYILGEISSLNFTIPAYNTLDGTTEIRVYFTTSSAVTSSIDTSNFTNIYGLSDIEFEANKSYELSFVPLTSTILTVIGLVNDYIAGLPYQELNYIESTGTQYIDTDIAQVTPTIETVVSVTTDTAVSWIFGGGANSRDWGVAYITNYNGTNYNVVGDTSYNWVKTNVNAVNNYVKIVLNNNVYTFNDSQSYSVSLTGDSTKNIYIGMIYSNIDPGNGAKARWKSFKIGSVRDYVPCYLTTNVTDYWGNPQYAGAIGLWDKVSDKFFPNNGTDDFVAGDPVY